VKVEKWVKNGQKGQNSQPLRAMIQGDLIPERRDANSAHPKGRRFPGDVHEPMYADSDLAAWAWMDSAHINFLTTIHQSAEVGTLQRRSTANLGRGQRGAGKSDHATLQCAIDYNRFMLGVDIFDSMHDSNSS